MNDISLESSNPVEPQEEHSPTSQNITEKSEALSVHVVVHDLWNGDSIVSAVGDLELCSYGRDDAAIEEQKMFFSEYFSRIYAEQIARFSLPKGARLHTTWVKLQCNSLPRRLQVENPMLIPSLIIPAAREFDVWVIVLPFNHTFYVEREKASGLLLNEAIASETQRIAAAYELDGVQFLNRLPGAQIRLATLSVAVAQEAPLLRGRAASMRAIVAENIRKKEALQILGSVATRLHDQEIRGLKSSPRPLLGREVEQKLLNAFLSEVPEGERTSILVVGAAGVGKSALFRSCLAQAAKEGRARFVFVTSGAQLIAGMSGLGQWQARIQRVMEAARVLNAILYFDTMTDLFAGKIGQGGVDFAGAMKPFLEEGLVQIIGELHPNQLDSAETRHVGFFSSFTRVKCEPLTATQAKNIVKAHCTYDHKHEPNKPQLNEPAILALIDLADRFLPHLAYPGKAMQLYQEARAIHETSFDRTDSNSSESQYVREHEIYELFSVRTGIPVFLLRDDRTLQLEHVLGELGKHVIGQHDAVRCVAETLCVVKAGLQSMGKPLASFLFVGPTGVGKTELARALARFLFGHESRLIRFDMSEYTDASAADRLIRGTDTSDGLLTRKIREQPFAVLLLDEIEKAHPAVFDLLLQVCGEARLTDARGKTAYFQNAIIIMTSNLGATHASTEVGFRDREPMQRNHEHKRSLKNIESAFRPEFINRLDRIITFDSLTQVEIQSIARVAIGRIQHRRGLADRGIELNVSELALDMLAQEGFHRSYGARALRRHLDTALLAPISFRLSEDGEIVRNSILWVQVHDEPLIQKEGATLFKRDLEKNLSFTWLKPTRSGVVREQNSIDSISARRRELDRQFQLDRIEQVKAQIETFVAQLNYGDESSRKTKMQSHVLAEIQSEHHRIFSCYNAMVEARNEMYELEELAIGAFFAGESISELSQDARRVYKTWNSKLVQALVTLEPVRDDIWLLVQELDDERAFDRWLTPFLKQIKLRDWAVEIHLDGDKPKNTDPDWPEYRRWGPSRSVDDVLERLAQEKRDFRAVILHVQGPYAGVFLALEQGLHRWVEERPERKKIHMMCRCIGLQKLITKGSFNKKTDPWMRSSFMPISAVVANEFIRSAPVREIEESKGLIHLFDRRGVVSGYTSDYWAVFDEIVLHHLLIFEQEQREDIDVPQELERDTWFSKREPVT